MPHVTGAKHMVFNLSNQTNALKNQVGKIIRAFHASAHPEYGLGRLIFIKTLVSLVSAGTDVSSKHHIKNLSINILCCFD